MQPTQMSTPPAAMPLALIVAVAKNGVIGDRNRLPWHLPEDLKRFRRLTTGHAVIMGRKTWESLAKPLPDRQNIVVTRDTRYVAPGADVAASLQDALARVRLPAPAFCIGGGEIYRIALPLATTLHVTEIDRAFAGDVAFPAIDATQWRETHRETMTSSGTDPFTYAYVTRERRTASR